MKFKPLLGTDLSGHIGGVVASHNTYGPYFRQRVRPVNRKTAAQRAQRSAVAATSQQWRALDPTVRAAWIAAAIVKTSRKGDRVVLSGSAAYQFVNTIRTRAGLAPINSPPTSPDVPSLTTPTATFTASDTIDLAVALTDGWNAMDGWMILSASLITSPGVAYKPANQAVTIEVGPVASSPISVTLPFAVPIGGAIKLTAHAGSPDGRQSQYVDVEASNLSYAPPLTAPRRVLGVTLVGTSRFLWRFDGPVTVTPGSEVNMVINGDTPATVSQAAPDSLTALYTVANAIGLPWSIALQPSQIAQAVALPQTGTTD